MDPVVLVVVPGLVGGLVIALAIFLRQRRGSDPASLAAAPRPHHLSTDIINASSIRVAGIGGLGLVAMAAAVALNVPRIGQTLAIGLILGLALAAVMILRRRRTGAMPSSGRRAGADTILSLETQAPAAPRGRRDQLDLAATRA